MSERIERWGKNETCEVRHSETQKLLGRLRKYASTLSWRIEIQRTTQLCVQALVVYHKQTLPNSTYEHGAGQDGG